MKRREWYEAGLVLVAFAALTVVMTWPVTAHLRSRLIGDTIDLWVAQWDNWWLLTALRERLDPWFTRYLFYPDGINLSYHSFGWANMLLWLPLQALLGQVAAYNVSMLLTFVLAGAGAYYLTLDITGSRPAAALAGAIYAFAPYHIWESLGHPNLASIQWLPWGLLFFRRTLQGTDRKAPWLAGLFLGLSGLAGAHMLIFTFLMAALYLAADFVFGRQRWNRRTWQRLVPVVVIALVVTLPITLPVVRDVSGGGSPGDMLLDEGTQAQTDLQTFFIPGRIQVLGRLVSADRVEGASPFGAYLGVIPVLLALVAAVGDRRRSAFWLGSALLWMVLALGSQLRISGRVVEGISLPYGWLASTPVMGVIRIPARFNILLGLSLAVAAGIGWAFLARQVRRPAARWGLTVAVVALLLVEYGSWPFPTSAPQVSAYIESDKQKGAVLTLPTGRQNSKFAMYDQTAHERPLVEGVAARAPEGAYDFLASIPMLQLSDDQQMQFGPAKGVTAVSEQLRLLNESGITSIILYKDIMWPNLLAEWRDFFTIAPVFEDDDIAVYTTQPVLGQDFELERAFSNGVGIIRATLSGTEIVQGEPVWLDIRWGTAEPPRPGLQAALQLLDANRQVAHTREWPAPRGSIDIAKQQLALSPFILPGRYELAMTLLEEGRQIGTLPLADELVVRPRERVFGAPLLTQPTSASFGNLFSLRSYKLDDDGRGIRLQWQALDRPPIDYKLFVHLINPAGEIVAQWDGMPLNWSYPTSWWEAQEIVGDHVHLDSAPAGEYTLRIGWYDPLTGKRLTTPDGDDFILIPASN